MDLSSLSGRSESDRHENDALLSKGAPLFVEVLEVLSKDTIKACLVRPAFGAPVDTRIHVSQIDTHNARDSLSKHIQGSDYIPALRRGDIVMFPQSFVRGGDAHVARVSGRTHDKMRGNVQFLECVAKVSRTTVGKRGAYQAATIIDGSMAYRAENTDDIQTAFRLISEMPWVGHACGFIARTKGGQVMEFISGKDSPLKAFLEVVDAKGIFQTDDWLEIIPASRFTVGRDQIVRDVDVKMEQERVVGLVGQMFMPEKSVYPGFRETGIILCDEDEWAYGAKTGKIHRVVAGIQPLNRKPAIDARFVPSRAKEGSPAPFKLTGLFGADLMARMAEERSERCPQDAPVAPKRESRPGFQRRPSSDHHSQGDEGVDSQNVLPTMKRFW